MINKKQTIKNALFSVTQVIISGISLFIVYKYLLLVIGTEKLGVWSIVMAISSVARISDLGFAGGMVKFVSKYTAREEQSAVSEFIQTGAISIVVFIGLILCVAYTALQFFAPRIFTPDHLDDAVALIPYALISFGLIAVSGIFLSSLDGFQRVDLRNILMITSTALYVSLIIILVNKFGFIGLGYAQVSQSAFILIASWIMVRRIAQIRAVVPFVWKRRRFQEMFSYNVNLQISTVAILFLEPTAKILLGKFGDFSMVTYFEMANKLIMQFRAIVVNANQVLVPVISELQEKQQERIASLYQQTYEILFFISLTVYSAIAILIPLISEVWIGSHNDTFINFSYIILMALFLNTMVGPAYFSNMGTGNVKINTKSQVLIGIFNLILAVIMGLKIGGYGVVMGYALSIVIGSVFLIRSFFWRYKIPYASLIPQGQRIYFCCLLILAIGFPLCFHWFLKHTILIKAGITFTALLFLIPLSFVNPVTQKVLNKFKNNRKH